MGMSFPRTTPPPYGSAETTKVNIIWVPVDAQRWNWDRVLYLFQNPDGSIYYIGKAYDCTVSQRRQDHVKEGLITLVSNADPAQCQTILVGVPEIQAGQKILTESLVNDIEALLIRQVRPSATPIEPMARAILALGRGSVARCHREGVRFGIVVVRSRGGWPVDSGLR